MALSGRKATVPNINTGVGAYDSKLVTSSLTQLSSTNETSSPITAAFPALAHLTAPRLDTSSAVAPASEHRLGGLGLASSGIGINKSSISCPSLISHGHGVLHSRPSSTVSGAGGGAGVPGHSHVGHGGLGIGGGSNVGGGGAGPMGGSMVNGMIGFSGVNTSVDVHPSHPSSPWSVLSLHVLPVFNGMPLMQPIEEMNKLAESHISNSRARSPRSYLSLLSSDLQELISTGMLTLRSKLDSVSDEGKLLARAAESWWFFFGIVPYIQGVFLPFSILMAEQNASPDPAAAVQPGPSTDVRHLLLSSFLLHILLPLRLRFLHLLNQVALHDAPGNRQTSSLVMPTSDQLGRLQHMSLILSTQAKCSSLTSANIFTDVESNKTPKQKDDAVRRDVEELLKVILRIRNGGKPAYLPVLGGRDHSRRRETGKQGGDEDGVQRGWVGIRPRRKTYGEVLQSKPEASRAELEEESAYLTSGGPGRRTVAGHTRPRGISTGESSLGVSDDESNMSQAGVVRYPSSMDTRATDSVLSRAPQRTRSELSAHAMASTFQSEATSSTATPTPTLLMQARDRDRTIRQR